MNDRQREQIQREFEAVKEACARAPIPEDVDLPEWAREGGIENLAEFFNGAAHLWDAKFDGGYDDLHQATAAQISSTDEAVRILDVGCGTGLAFAFVFERASNARITGIDQAPRMLDEVRRKYPDRLDQIELIETSCLDWPAGLADFDYVVSNLVTHHFAPEVKKGIYRDIRSALKQGGVYIEGDQAVKSENEAAGLKLFEAWIARLPEGERGAWNYDVTLSAETNMRLMRESGFGRCEVRWELYDEGGNGHAVIAAR